MKITTIVDYKPYTGLSANVVLHLVDAAERKAGSLQQRNSYTPHHHSLAVQTA